MLQVLRDAIELIRLIDKANACGSGDIRSNAIVERLVVVTKSWIAEHELLAAAPLVVPLVARVRSGRYTAPI